MSERNYSFDALIKLQRYSWYIIFCYFTVAVSLYFFKTDLPFEIGFVGVILVLSATVLKIFVLAEKFRHMHLIRYVFLSYALLAIILITVAYRLLR